MKSKFLFTAGIVGMLSNVASGATDGADADVVRDWNPYVTLRGGWVFGGKGKCNFTDSEHPECNKNSKENIKNAWSGSAEFGVSCCDERVFMGLELGYFTGKATSKVKLDPAAPGLNFPAEFGNAFGACNVTLRHDVGERGFWYGGFGAGIARVSVTADASMDGGLSCSLGSKAWSFLGQGFTGFGLCLNDNWSLTVGYRLRYVPGNVKGSFRMNTGPGMPSEEFALKVKQDLLHAAEVGLTYRF